MHASSGSMSLRKHRTVQFHKYIPVSGWAKLSVMFEANRRLAARNTPCHELWFAGRDISLLWGHR